MPHLQGAESTDGVSFREALRAWAYVGLNSFGGPAGQIAVMHREIVERRRWLGERRFLHALNYCMLLPGPEAQQLATYVGWLLHGVRGGLAAGLLFVLPGVVAMMALSVLYAGFQQTTPVQALFYGIKPAVVAVVIVAVIAIGRRALVRRLYLAIAALAFVAMFFFDLPFPLVVVGAAVAGLLGRQAHDGAVTADIDAVGSRPRIARSLVVLAIGLTVWLAPPAVLFALLGRDNVFVQEALFFSGAAVVTFGGAYGVLSFIAQQAVSVYGWLAPTEMLDGLGMAESTPGPLIMVVQFVGFMAAFRAPGELDPMVAGALGGLLVTWVTFAPSFLWIFLGGPYAEYLRGRPALSAALSGISAAVVGVILNLAAWFSLQTLFAVTGEVRIGPLRLHTVELATLDPTALLLALFAAVALLRLRWPLLVTLAVSAAIGFVYYLATA
ncbi:MAG TPA: chromate efflux transporter [Candidatus Caenarcaniphilales bacterium]|nr:chromate efflux transporter [Candidatus Caenarcaniphilales bacterium]